MPDSSRELLDAAYSRLGFGGGQLFDALAEPDDATSNDWVNKGDWLTLAKKVGAEKVFFVNDYPVIVFAQQTNSDSAHWMRMFNSVWCMARPQMLFLARDGDLSVLNLTKKPARPDESPLEHDRLLASAKATADILEKLHAFRREQVESGRLFEDERFGFDDRADHALIRDLGRVRKSLIDTNLSPGYAHALIGRSIFIRYLEDRRVLDLDYFRKVARGNKKHWSALIEQALGDHVDLGVGHAVIYPYVLKNKGFTYALFRQLAKDFNGDMFPIDAKEEQAVTSAHLNALHQFLLGDKDQNLFFFAYRFDIIPIELISSIYEKFYSLQKQKRRDEGSYYTPSALVDFLLAETLTRDILANKPRVIDPACGSGIFLVEAFRRIVRHRVATLRRRLHKEELREILRNQIGGIDISSEAIRVAAFSLYLAMLHYLEPPNIQRHKRLPSLTFSTRPKTSKEHHFDILVSSDTFSIDETVSNPAVRERFLSQQADVVVGNPPWGAPPTNLPIELQSDGGIRWCKARNFAVGDKERSQTFLHRTRDLLKPGGRAGLLVSTGVFFKRHKNTRAFRKQWLGSTTLHKVVNFAAVRFAFFQNGRDPADPGRQGSIAPFAAVIFDNQPPPVESRFAYWSAKETAFVKRVQAVVLSAADIRSAAQADYVDDDTLWKIYWWGGHRDHALIQRLRLEPSFRQVVDPDGTRLRVGFQEASRKDPAGWLKEFMEFPTNAFERYGPLPNNKLIPPPTRVHRRREKFLYQGPRLLIKRGIDQNETDGGSIAARFETKPFSFRHSIYCVPTGGANGRKTVLTHDKAKILLGTLWSSLTRYYLFLTSGTWGLWHDDLRKEVLYTIPTRFPADGPLATEIVTIVNALRELPDAVADPGLFAAQGISKADRDALIEKLENQLDDAVYRLFELTDSERERINEFCDLELDLFYQGMSSTAVRPLDWPDSIPRFGRRKDLDTDPLQANELARYMATFLDLWEPQLQDQDGHLRWRVIRPPDASSMTAVILETEDAADLLPNPKKNDDQEWAAILAQIDAAAQMPTNSKRVYIDGLVRIVTDSAIAIIKRNQRRLWTKSAARDDAEAAMVLAIQLSEQPSGGKP